MNRFLESKFVFVNIPDGALKGEYVSRILSAQADVLELEHLAKGLDMIQAGIPLSVDFFDEGELYTFSSEIQNTTSQSILVRYPSNISKKQQRNYRRVPMRLDVDVSVMDYEISNTRTLRGKTIDVSGGGMRFKIDSDVSLAIGDLVVLEFALKDKNEDFVIIAKATVVRIEQSDESSLQICAVEFNGMKDEDRYVLMRNLLVN